MEAPYGGPEAPKGGVIRGVVFKRVEITVPHGRAPGSRLVVQAEGRLVTAVVPEGAQPGDVFPIHVPIELSKVQRLKLAPVQMLDWSLDKAEDLTKRAVRKIPGHGRVEALVDRVRRRRPQHPQQRAFEQRRGDSRGSHRGHRASMDHGHYDERSRAGGGGGGSARVIGSVREQVASGDADFAQFERARAQQQEPQQQQQRGSPMYPSVFDSPQVAQLAQQQPGNGGQPGGGGAATLDGFSDFFGEPEPAAQRPQPVPVRVRCNEAAAAQVIDCHRIAATRPQHTCQCQTS